MMQDSKASNFIQIKTTKTNYYPGAQVTGKVYLKIKSITHSNTTLILKLIGFEKIEIPNSSNIENNIYKHAIPIHIWRSGISINQYIHPFAFVLKDNLPASFKYSEQHQDYIASVRYELKAELVTSGSVNTISQPQSIIIVQKLPNKPVNAVEKIINFTRMCGIISTGSLVIRISTPLDNFEYGKEIIIKLEMDNSKNSLKIDQIKCQIYRKITLYDKERNIISKIEEIIKTNQIEGLYIDPRDCWSQNKSKMLNITLIDQNSNNSISSCTGELIESNYYAKITAVPSGCCISSDQPIDLELPIIISSLANNDLPSLNEWSNSQESPREDLIVIDAYRYAEGDRLRFTMNND